MPEQSRKISVCVAQINFHTEDIEGHLEKIKSIIVQHKSADLVIFPELILHGHPSTVKPEGYLYRQVKVHNKFVIPTIHEFIQAQGARVIMGELRRRGETYVNQAAYIDARGVQTYAKTHVHWTERFVPGRELKVFDSPFGKIGVTICFDSAFSEVWRVLALKGAEIIVNISAVPAHFPAEYMRRRLVGAAVFNQVFVIYANRPGPVFSGHSAVYDPRGDQVAALGLKEETMEVELDLEDVQRWRREEAVYDHRRPLLYRRVTDRGKGLSLVPPRKLSKTA